LIVIRFSLIFSLYSLSDGITLSCILQHSQKSLMVIK